MKNFKKVLALVLAVATVFTFAAMATAADVKYDDLTDTASITHVEAVQVLTGVGVIQGFEDKTFKPAESVTRVQMAKMVGYVMNNGDDINDLYKDACPFADSKSNWGAGYIAYCATQGIVNGRDANTFDPNATVTGTEAAKMLLCALGYDAKTEGFTGADWAVNVLKVAKQANLLKELSQSKMGVALNREDAAQMIFNALNAAEVEYANAGTTVVTADGTTVTTGASKASKIKNEHITFTSNGNTTADAVVLWGEDHFIDSADTAKMLKKVADNVGDDFGVKANIWKYGKNSDGTPAEISKDLKLAKTFVGSMSAAELYTLIGKKDNNDDITIKVDGAAPDTTNNFKLGKYTADDGTVTALTTADVVKAWTDGIVLNKTTATQRSGNKILADEIEVYVNDKATEGRTIQIIGKSYNLGKVNTYHAAKTSDDDEYITLSQEVGVNPGTAQFKTTAFTKADADDSVYVVFTYANSKIQSAKKVTAVKSGDVTKVTTDSDGFYVITADGKTYTYAKKNAAKPSVDAEYDLYLDPNGKVLFADETKSGSSNYYMVMKKAKVEGSGLDKADDVYQVRLLGTDGKTLDLNVSKINKKAVEEGSTWDLVTAAKTPGEKQEIADCTVGTIVTYTLDSKGKAELTTAAADDAFNVDAKTITIANYENLTEISKMLTTKKATSDTTFVLISLDKNDNYVYTPVSGIAAMKAVTANYEFYQNATVEVKSANSVATPDVAGVAFIFVGSRNVTSTKTVFTTLTKGDEKEETVSGKSAVKFYEVKAVEGNEVKTLKVKKAVFEDAMSADTDENGKIEGTELFNRTFVLAASYSVDEDGFVDRINEVTNAAFYTTADSAALKYEKGTLTIGTKEYAQDNVKVFLYDEDLDEITTQNVAKDMKDDIAAAPFYYFNTTSDTTKTVVAIFGIAKG